MALPPGIAGTKRPFDLPPATSVSNIDAIVVDDGISVRKATARQIVENAAPFATQAQAEAGTDQTTYMNPLLTAQAIAAQAVLPVTLASNAGAGLIGTDSGQTVQDLLNQTVNFPSYTNHAGDALVVNGTEDGVEWVPQSGGYSETLNVTTDYTLDPADGGKYIRIGDALPLTITVPLEATVPLIPDIEFNFRAIGDVTISPEAGVTVNPPSGGTLDLSEAMTVTLKRVGVDEFDLIGQTVTV